MLSNPQDESAWLLAIACFAILFPMFMRIPLPLPGWAHTIIKLAAYGIAVGMMAFTDYAAEEHFSLFTSNIIILLLANMAIFGSIIYLFTMRSWLARIAVLAALAGIVLSAQTEGSWVQALYTYSPLPWMYRFEYLRYLFIVLPGSMAGDLLLKWMNHSAENTDMHKAAEASRRVAYGVLAISVSIIFICLIGLYNRWSFLTFALSALLLIIGWWLLRERQGSGALWRELFLLGAALLLVGLCFEPFQGASRRMVPHSVTSLSQPDWGAWHSSPFM